MCFNRIHWVKQRPNMSGWILATNASLKASKSCTTCIAYSWTSVCCQPCFLLSRNCSNFRKTSTPADTLHQGWCETRGRMLKSARCSCNSSMVNSMFIMTRDTSIMCGAQGRDGMAARKSAERRSMHHELLEAKQETLACRASLQTARSNVGRWLDSLTTCPA